MRSNRGVAAVERLKRRSGKPHYAMTAVAGGLFLLVERDEQNSTPLCAPLPLDAFVAFVDAYGPQPPRHASKLDRELERQIAGHQSSKSKGAS